MHSKAISQTVNAGMMVLASADAAEFVLELTMHAAVIEVSAGPAHLPRASPWKVAEIITSRTILRSSWSRYRGLRHTSRVLSRL